MRPRILLWLGLALGWVAGPATTEPTPFRSRGVVEAEAPGPLEAVVSKLNLTRRQKLQVARILKDSKAAGDDRETTLRKVATVLSEEQKQTLRSELKAAGNKTP